MWTPVANSDASPEINVDFTEGGKQENPEKNPGGRKRHWKLQQLFFQMSSKFEN